MPTPQQDKVNFSGFIPRDLYERFVEKFPMYGSVTWFITSSVAEFLDRVDKDPSLQDKIEDSIKAMVHLNQPR